MTIVTDKTMLPRAGGITLDLGLILALDVQHQSIRNDKPAMGRRRATSKQGYVEWLRLSINSPPWSFGNRIPEQTVQLVQLFTADIVACIGRQRDTKFFGIDQDSQPVAVTARARAANSLNGIPI